MAATERLLTLDQFASLPDDGWRAELVRGRLVREPPAGFYHGELAMRLGAALHRHVSESAIGGVVVAAETGFVLADEPLTVRAPDAAYVSMGRLPASHARMGYARLAPDLAVEVVSPSNRASDVQAKVMDYLAAGCRMVWVVDPLTRSVTVYRSPVAIQLLQDHEVLEGADVLPGLAIPLAELFDAPI